MTGGEGLGDSEWDELEREMQENFRKKYPGYDPTDTVFDELQRDQGQMTNREFFTSNGPGGFYEGMIWNELLKEWIHKTNHEAD